MGNTAIVTGAAGGIGFAVTQALYRAGWEVLAAIHTPSKAACFTEMADRVHWVCADIGTAQGRKQIMERAEAFATIDLLVNVAGIAPKVRADCEYFLAFRLHQFHQPWGILYLQGRCVHDYQAVCRPAGRRGHRRQ